MTTDRRGSDAELLDRIQKLRSILPAMAAEVAMARREVARLRRENAALQNRVAELEGRPPVPHSARQAQAMRLRLRESDRRDSDPWIGASRPSRTLQQSLR
jgi:phage shock protein A